MTTVSDTPTEKPEWAEAAERVRQASAALKDHDADTAKLREARDAAMLEMRAKKARPVDLAHAAGITSAAIAKWLRKHEDQDQAEAS